ncbi:hypothetical protein C2I36_08475 [Rhodobacteraceae bacterium WD3A24]|nr:hypothetical protein C2I36_08475 [Rhodobacteraceae bacterium WD3A24]
MGWIRTAALAVCTAALAGGGAAAQTLSENNERMFRQMQQARDLSDATMARIRAIFAESPYIGQGNPSITRHPMTPEQARARIGGDPEDIYRNPRFERICGAPYMVPLYDPETERPEDATVCADMFEYPNVPLAYPVTWVRASEAAQLCAAEGKRIGDAHEWESASAGRLLDPDYRFDLAQGVGASSAVSRMRNWHNQHYGPTRRWSYGTSYQSGICATGSSKSPGCDGGSFAQCGSNTYPAGSFPQCRSPLGVYDIDGNAAEHMNLPLAPDQMASRGSTTLGVTEMKGSWFIWDTIRAHEDWSRWRAPFWHGSRVMSPSSHRNYHLGFRCFRDVG